MCLAIPGRVEEITTDGLIRIGPVNFGGVVKRVCLDYVPEIAVGDYAIVHVGFAISKIDEKTAQEDARSLSRHGRAGRGTGQRGRDVCAGRGSAAVDLPGRKLSASRKRKFANCRSSQLAIRLSELRTRT